MHCCDVSLWATAHYGTQDVFVAWHNWSSPVKLAGESCVTVYGSKPWMTMGSPYDERTTDQQPCMSPVLLEVPNLKPYGTAMTCNLS